MSLRDVPNEVIHLSEVIPSMSMREGIICMSAREVICHVHNKMT